MPRKFVSSGLVSFGPGTPRVRRLLARLFGLPRVDGYFVIIAIDDPVPCQCANPDCTGTRLQRELRISTNAVSLGDLLEVTEEALALAGRHWQEREQ